MPAKLILSGKIVCAECGTEVGEAQVAPCELRMNTGFALTASCNCRMKLPTPQCKLPSVPKKMIFEITDAQRIY